MTPSKGLLISGLVVIFLVAFMMGEAPTKEGKEKEKTYEVVEVVEPSREKVLTEPGQKRVAERNTHELLKIETINEEIDIHPVKIKVEDIKLYAVEETRGDDWNYLQITYKSESSSDKIIDWEGITWVSTGKEELEAISDDLAYTDNVGTIHSDGVIREHVLVLKVREPDINKIELVMGGTTERTDEGDLKLSDGKTISYEMTES